MRVLHLIETLGRGGTEQALVNVLPSLRAKGVDVEVCALRPPYTLAADIERQGFLVHRLDIFHRWDLAHAVPRVAALLRRDYDALHGHSFFPALYMALVRPPPRAPRFVTFHSLDYDSYPARTPWHRVRKRLDSWLMNHAIEVRLAVSPAVADHYRDHLALESVQVVHNAICVGDRVGPATSDERGDVMRRFGVDTSGHLLIVPSRYVHEKGHRYFVEAFETLMMDRPKLRALFVGDGPLHKDIEELVRSKGLADRIHVHGAAAHADLMELIAASSVVVLPSTHEGFGLAAAEGMALSKPVVATSVGGIPLLIRDDETGLLVPPADAKALAAAIERLLRDPALRQRLGERASKHIEENFAPPIIASHLASHYAAAIERSGAPESARPSAPPPKTAPTFADKATRVARGPDVAVVDFGMGNLHSVRTKLERAGARVIVTADPTHLRRADKLVLPGVGHFAHAMRNLRELGLVDVLNEEALARKKPVLGICLGMQLMARRGEEGDVGGLGWIDAEAERFKVPDTRRFKVPHIGWGRVTMRRQSGLFADIAPDAEFYFVHSYALKTDSEDLVVSESEYAHPFPSAIERGNLFGVQFHPEKSHVAGERLLVNFLGL